MNNNTAFTIYAIFITFIMIGLAATYIIPAMSTEQPVIKCEREPIVKYYDMDTEKRDG